MYVPCGGGGGGGGSVPQSSEFLKVFETQHDCTFCSESFQMPIICWNQWNSHSGN